MKVTLSWLKQYADFDWSPEELTERLTMLGLEVEGVQRIGGEFEGIGANLVYVFGDIDDFGRPQPMTYAEVQALSDSYRVPEAMLVMPQLDLRNQQGINAGAMFYSELKAMPEVMERMDRVHAAHGSAFWRLSASHAQP